jgi:hypothetical protein
MTHADNVDLEMILMVSRVFALSLSIVLVYLAMKKLS